MVSLLPNDSSFTLNNRGAYAVADNTAVSFACVGVLNDANIEWLHSAVNLSSNESLTYSNVDLRNSELPYGPIRITFTQSIIDGNLTCRSRTSGREQSVYIGGIVYIHTFVNYMVYMYYCIL